MKKGNQWLGWRLICGLVVLLILRNTAEGAVSKYSDVFSASEKFISSLSSEQKDMAVVGYNQANAVKWTNLPCGLQCRVGILFGSLSASQLSLAKNVAKAALGASIGAGYDQVMGIMEADAFLGKGRKEYSSDNYIIAFLGMPDRAEKWQLQIGGHHLAVNLTFNMGRQVSASPLFMGLEPPENTTLKGNHDALVDVLKSLTDSQLAKARLVEGYGDVFVGPGKDGAFPVIKAGIKASELSPQQKSKVLKAILQWVHIADESTAKELMKTYRLDLNDTFVAFYGGVDLSKKSDYVRIDGPSVWIEFICQPGAVFPQGIHYHTVYRDHLRDYASSFQFGSTKQ
ncbi:DUF3500 domain-containing protein [Pedobacter sp. JCM 36344]|uniref:DUF3500 domain-containing protein n=1 Tax=Pedobacter sp. JCM 36344 TaxID=3374280 RepID=UPI00397B3EE2